MSDFDSQTGRRSDSASQSVTSATHRRVLLHPVGLDGECWRFLTPDVLEGAVQYTLLRHGSRGGDPQGLTIQAMAQDVLDSVDGQLDLVGVSMGAVVAQEIAMSAPSRVGSVLLCSTSAGGKGGQVQRDRASVVERLGVGATVEGHIARWFSSEARSQLQHSGIDYVRSRLLADSPDLFAAGWRALADLDCWDRLHLIKAPTTVVHPFADGAESRSSSRRMAEMITNARYVELPGVHMLHLEKPAAFSEIIRAHEKFVTFNARV